MIGMDGGDFQYTRWLWKLVAGDVGDFKGDKRFTVANIRIVFGDFRNELAVQTLVNKQMATQKLHPVISFTEETEFSGKKDFLSCDKNKAAMITLISAALIGKGCHVIQSPSAADVDIAKATVERSRHCTTTLVGEDTDLILLLHYSSTDNENTYFRFDANKQSTERRVCNINL